MKKVGILMGSDSDLPIIKKATAVLDDLCIPYTVNIYSAHRTPEQARDFALNARSNADEELFSDPGSGHGGRRCRGADAAGAVQGKAGRTEGRGHHGAERSQHDEVRPEGLSQNEAAPLVLLHMNTGDGILHPLGDVDRMIPDAL